MSLINGLHFRNLKGDLFGGITAAVVALPLALAMGVSSGAGPIAGIYGAICVGFFASLFGGTPAQISGPTGPMTVVMALIFSQYTSMFPDQPELGASLAFTVVVMGGLFQIALGLLNVGRFIELVPYPVISGFMSGIGVIIILLQIGPVLGVDSPSKPVTALVHIPQMLESVNADALLLGLVSLAIVYIVPARFGTLNRYLPAPLFALLVGMILVTLVMPGSQAPELGAIPSGVPDLVTPAFQLKLLPGMIESALVLAALGSIDSLLTSLVADNITRVHHRPKRELIGQGIGNTLAGLIGGLPGAGATMRTVVNVKAGGATPLSGIAHSLILLAVIVGAGELASHIPKAVLAGILIKVGTDIIDWDYLRRAKSAPMAGNMIVVVVLLLTVFVDLIVAVAVGMVMASMIFLKRMVDLELNSIDVITDPDQAETPLSEEERSVLREAQGQVLLYHFGGPMSFGAAKEMSRRLMTLNDYQALVLDLSDVPLIDFTSSRTLEDMIQDTQRLGRGVFIIKGCEQVTSVLEKRGVLSLVPAEHRHQMRLPALVHASNFVRGLGNSSTS